MNLQTGAFGDPSSTETLILFWSKMEELHYPTAAEVKNQLQQQMERQSEAMRQVPMGGMDGMGGMGGMDAGTAIPGGTEGGALV